MRVLVAVLLVAHALAAPSPPAKAYVSSWRSTYLAFRSAYLRSLTPCLRGASTSCSRAQLTARARAVRLTGVLARTRPPARLARPHRSLRHGVSELARALGLSVRYPERFLCRAEAGPCTGPEIAVSNAIGVINDRARTELPILG